MKPPLYHLKFLLGVQLALLVLVSGIFFFFRAKFDRLEKRQEITIARTEFVKHYIVQDNENKLRRDALISLEQTASDGTTIVAMEADTMNLFATACFILFSLTTWLGFILFKFQRSGRSA
jgi:hypothetical protein